MGSRTRTRGRRARMVVMTSLGLGFLACLSCIACPMRKARHIGELFKMLSGLICTYKLHNVLISPYLAADPWPGLITAAQPVGPSSAGNPDMGLAVCSTWAALVSVCKGV